MNLPLARMEGVALKMEVGIAVSVRSATQEHIVRLVRNLHRSSEALGELRN